jgi:hypothetical protein
MKMVQLQCVSLLTILSNEHWSVIVPVLHIGNSFLHALWVNIEPIKWSLHITIQLSRLGWTCKVNDK